MLPVDSSGVARREESRAGIATGRTREQAQGVADQAHTSASKDAIVTREPARADKQIKVDRVQEANGGPIETEVATPGRESYVRLALVCLQGGSISDEPAQPPSPHRRVPEEVSLHAGRRPRHQCALSDGGPLSQPLDVMLTAAETALSILHHWLHYATRGSPLRDSEHVSTRMQARTLAACVFLLDDLAPRMEPHISPFAGVERVADIVTRTWHAWCAEAARQVLWRAFPRHFVYGSGTGTALLEPSQGMAEVRAEWLGTITKITLNQVRQRVLGEYHEAWKHVERSERSRHERESEQEPALAKVGSHTDDIWQIVALLKDENDLTQDDLAAALDVNRRTVQNRFETHRDRYLVPAEGVARRQRRYRPSTQALTDLASQFPGGVCREWLKVAKERIDEARQARKGSRARTTKRRRKPLR